MTQTTAVPPSEPLAITDLTRAVVYPESPRWHADRIWFSDVHDYTIKTIDLAGAIEVIAAVPGRPAGIGVLPDAGVLMATALDAKLNRVVAGSVIEVADLAPLVSGLLNDMIVDSRGRAYVGDTGFRPGIGEAEGAGRLVCWSEGGSARVVAEDLAFPNGLAITDDNTVLYVAETRGQRITRFAVTEDGSLEARTTVAELECRPDGICLDEAGALWVAATRAGKFLRLSPAGEILMEIPSPGATAVACVFVGAERDDLLLCSADTTPERLGRGISNGRMDLVHPGRKGAGRP
ncbi:SMP-30/gluconolactonase/LRE family protein [Pseudonocardia sp. GCM10023141]|uniref:SMP-30/gluconolactonase/LRE family protein n=1 Tax=Pseudonocardia sp. GCM10023141 TaxID=3252653 RepID=UPI00361E19B1